MDARSTTKISVIIATNLWKARNCLWTKISRKANLPSFRAKKEMGKFAETKKTGQKDSKHCSNLSHFYTERRSIFGTKNTTKHKVLDKEFCAKCINTLAISSSTI